MTLHPKLEGLPLARLSTATSHDSGLPPQALPRLGAVLSAPLSRAEPPPAPLTHLPAQFAAQALPVLRGDPRSAERGPVQGHEGLQSLLAVSRHGRAGTRRAGPRAGGEAGAALGAFPEPQGFGRRTGRGIGVRGCWACSTRTRGEGGLKRVRSAVQMRVLLLFYFSPALER